MRVVVADDNALLRAGIVELLRQAGFDVVGQTGDADAVVGLVEDTEANVVVLDIRMPPTHTLEGLRVAGTLRERHGADVGIVLLSQYLEVEYALQLLAEGSAGIGYLLKDRVLDPGDLADAVRRVGDGGSAIDPVVIDAVLRRRHEEGPLRSLTPREREVLAAMAEGRSNQSIAGRLSISEKTVEACTGRIFAKLGLEPGPDDHRRVRAVLAYLRSARDQKPS